MTKNEKIIYDLLLKEAGEEQLVEETNANNSTTQICEEQNYNFKAGYEMPRDFQCAGVENAGKYMRVGTDGYIRPMAGSGGGEGYEPDFTTIGLTSNGELAVIDYISATQAEALVQANVSFSLDAPNLTSLKVGNTVYKITGGGEGDPVILIKGTATITDPTSLVDIPITITTPNFYDTLEAFYEENGRLPRIIADVSLTMSGEEISHIQIDMFANNIDLENEEIQVQGALCEESASISYIEFAFEPERQQGYLSAIQLQRRLTEDSEISARKINIGRYFVTESVMEALNHTMTDVNTMKTSKQNKLTAGQNITIDETDPANPVISATGGSGGSKYYLHCIEVLDDNNNINFYLRFINTTSSTYSSWSQLINETKKMWGWGRTNQQASTYHRYDLTVMADNGTLLFLDEENNTYELEEVKITSITDRGCVEL